MAVRRLLILGANNPETLRVVMATNDRAPTFEVVGFLDNDPAKHGRELWGVRVLGPSGLVAAAEYRDCVVVNSITRDPATRRQTTRELIRHGGELVNLIHPTVDTRLVRMGVGNIVHEGVVLQAGVVIGDNCAFNGNSIVSHECVIADHVFVAPGATLAGLVRVGEAAMLGVGSVVLPRLSIGPGAMVGGGAVATRDVAAGTVVVGNPARVLSRLTRWNEDAVE